MSDWYEAYEKNKSIDNMFIQKYANDELIYAKNCIEFLVELGEFINETKCFKYWSTKSPKRDDMLEELADVFTMLMYFYNISNSSINFVNEDILDRNLFELINETYYLGTKLYKDLNQELLDNIFINLLTISKIIGIEENEIIAAIKKKHIIVEERLISEY